MNWTKIDKDDEGTWPTPDLDPAGVLLWGFGDTEWDCASARTIRNYPGQYHGDFWADPPNPQEQTPLPADDGCVEVLAAVALDDDGNVVDGVECERAHEGRFAKLLEGMRRDPGVQVTVARFRAQKYTPPPVVEVEGEVE